MGVFCIRHSIAAIQVVYKYYFHTKKIFKQFSYNSIKSHYCHTSQKINIQDIHTSSCTIKHTQRFPAHYHSPARHCTFSSSVSRRAHHTISNKDLSYSSTTFFFFSLFPFYFRYSYMIKININASLLFPIQEINK